MSYEDNLERRMRREPGNIVINGLVDINVTT